MVLTMNQESRKFILQLKIISTTKEEGEVACFHYNPMERKFDRKFLRLVENRGGKDHPTTFSSNR